MLTCKSVQNVGSGSLLPHRAQHNAFVTPLLVRGDDLQRPLPGVATLAYLAVFIAAMAASHTRAFGGVRAQQSQIGVSCFGLYSAGVDGDFDAGTE